MNNIEKYIKHFKTITKHKFYVMQFYFLRNLGYEIINNN